MSRDTSIAKPLLINTISLSRSAFMMSSRRMVPPEDPSGSHFATLEAIIADKREPVDEPSTNVLLGPPEFLNRRIHARRVTSRRFYLGRFQAGIPR